MPPDTPLPPTAPVNAQGVIHDIGYRHYTEERGGRGYIRRSLFVDGLRGAYGLGRSGRSKVMPMLLAAVMALPALVIVIISAVISADELVAEYPGYLLNLQIVISIYVAAQAPVTVSRDLRFGVMSLYFSRPLERVDYVLAKYGSLAAALFLLTAGPLTIMFVGALVLGLPISEHLPDYLRSVAGAAVLSLILAGIGLVIAAITPRRGLAVAAVVTVLVMSSGVQAVTQGIAYEQGAGDGAAYLGLLSPFTLVQGVQTAVFGAASPLPSPPGTAGAAIFALAAVAVMAACFGVLLLRYRSVSVS